jgi:hypothetical protein
MDQALVASLTAVAELMESTQDPWWIIVRAAVALHGADPGPVGDVDILLSLRDALRIIPTLGLAFRRGPIMPNSAQPFLQPGTSRHCRSNSWQASSAVRVDDGAYLSGHAPTDPFG